MRCTEIYFKDTCMSLFDKKGTKKKSILEILYAVRVTLQESSVLPKKVSLIRAYNLDYFVF